MVQNIYSTISFEKVLTFKFEFLSFHLRDITRMVQAGCGVSG